MPVIRESEGTGWGSRSPRIVLLGASGRLGSSLVRHLAAEPVGGTGGPLHLHSFDRGHVNLANPGLIDAVLGSVDFDLLINCAAYTAVDDCEVQSGHAYLINGHAAGQIARICSNRGARMIHFSTDYVFDGTKGGPYTEDDAPNPINVYGRSKWLGEQQVLEAGPAHLVIRLAWLFGPGRPSFPEWVKRQAATGAVRVVADKSGCPTYSEDVARWLDPLLFGPQAIGGLLHLCNPPQCSWFDYATAVLEIIGSDATATPIAMRDLPGLQAPRPVNSALDTSKFERLTGIRCRPWHEALAEHLRS